jgi:hypothetical protein
LPLPAPLLLPLPSPNALSFPTPHGQTHPYILPGSTDPTKSAIECNLTPTGTKCGAIPMPANQIMTAADFQAIDTWIWTCGAPLN